MVYTCNWEGTMHNEILKWTFYIFVNDFIPGTLSYCSGFSLSWYDHLFFFICLVTSIHYTLLSWKSEVLLFFFTLKFILLADAGVWSSLQAGQKTIWAQSWAVQGWGSVSRALDFHHRTITIFLNNVVKFRNLLRRFSFVNRTLKENITFTLCVELMVFL